MSVKNAPKPGLSVFQMAVITTISVASMFCLPAMATQGLASAVMYLMPAFLFFVPVALVSAELGAAYPGGIYVWVREAFGSRMGFLAVWLQWIQNVVWYPIQLAFVAASAAFAIGKGDLSNSGLYTGLVIIAVYWLATLLTLRGGNAFAKIGSVGGVAGALVPAALLIALGAAWLLSGKPVSPALSQSSWLPEVSGLSSLVLLVSNVFAFSGMEMNAVHVGDMKERRGYNKALLLAFVFILGIFVLPTLSIAAAVPAEKLGMDNGILVAFQTFFDTWRVGWLSNLVALAIAFGAMAAAVTWLAGPSKGLLAAAKTGLLPLRFQKQNKHGVQSGILIPQGIIVTILALIYIVLPGVSDVFLSLIDMAAALYVIMYILMFAAAIVLRKKEKGVQQGYKVPALKLVAGVGIVTCAVALVMSFIPLGSERAIPKAIYPALVAAVVVVLGAPPLLFYALRKPKWDTRQGEE